jgi:hypothetical protein
MKYALLLLLPFVLVAQEWTVLVYVAADNDLAQWADSDLVEMESVGSSSDVRVVVQIDKPSIGARRLLVGQGGSALLGELGIIDMCSWETLSNFLAWGMTSFPAEKYLVILWDHGTGWTAAPHRSFGTDWSSGNVLSIANGDLHKALSSAFEFTRERINVLAFDACLMQQIEVGFEVRPYANLLLAPQSIMPLEGFRYDDILQALHSDPSMGGTKLCLKIIQSTVDNYTGIQPITISAIRVSRLNEIADIFIDLVSTLCYGLPNQALQDMRRAVQTIPAIGCTPDTSDDFVDLGDFFAGLDVIYEQSAVDHVLEAYARTIVATDHWGEEFSRATGLTVWFPDKYSQFKQLLNLYMSLQWVGAKWLVFLNWFYNTDDIRPTTPFINTSVPGASNDFLLQWSMSYDLAPVTYNIIESRDTSLIFHDPCEDSSHWYLNGFALSSINPHSGSFSLFSGNTANSTTQLETRDNITIQHMGLLSLFLYYSTEDMIDSLVIEYGTFRDVHYGVSNGWIERSIVLPPGSYPLRIWYRTNGAINLGGCYIDDIEVHELDNALFVRQNHQDTSIYVYNKLRGDYLYGVWADDRYLNTSNVSDLVSLSVEEYAMPYSIPNPFQTTCYIAVDYPDTLNPTVQIFSLRGSRVRKFETGDIINQRIYWDGKDEQGREVGSGIYFVLLKDNSFEKLGKIARQR